MQAFRRRKLLQIGSVLALICIALALILYALRQNISLFYTPAQIAAGQAPLHHAIRLGGMVKKGSVIRVAGDLSVRFTLTDFKSEIPVSYKGILPDLFREGQGIVAEGQLRDATHFEASRVLAKHDENYMPPQLKDSLKQQKATL